MASKVLFHRFQTASRAANSAVRDSLLIYEGTGTVIADIRSSEYSESSDISGTPAL